jgi:hypothetical protein
VGVSLDDGPEGAVRMINRHHLTFPVVHDEGHVLWLFLDARPRAEVAPYTEGGTLLALPTVPGVHLVPGGLWGAF